MHTHPACQLLDLANNECCGISMCPQCQVLHLRIGPVTLKLPPHLFQAVYGAMQQAAEKLPAHLPCEAAVTSRCEDTRH
ncbi:MAG: hypothetical protein M3436_08365 [Pseudomonadota bacterium]|nr:hypothetical protein [Pseudomonadota bacterium]